MTQQKFVAGDQYTLLHLSDIHLKVEHSQFLEVLAEKISGTVIAQIPIKEQVIFVISGDLAFSGQVEQYELFENFLRLLRNNIDKSGKSTGYQYIIVPGNHDCDFRSAGAIRNALLTSNEIFDKEIVSSIAQVQSNYVEFYRRVTGRELSVGEIYKLVTIDNIINFIEVNTSWTSRLHDLQAQIRMPEPGIGIYSNGRINICVQHHPFNWIKAEDAHVIRSEILNHCQISFSGHEHSPEKLYTFSRDEHGTLFIEAGAIIDGSQTAKFNVLRLDIINNNLTSSGYLYRVGDDYAELISTNNYFGLIKEAKHPRSLKFTQGFLGIINKVDSVIGNTGDLKLADVYIYPNLDNLSLNVVSSKTVISKDVFETLRREKRTIVYGQPSSGKTSLCYKLCFDIQKAGLSPVLISGRNLKSLKDTTNSINNALKLMYSGIQWGNYAQIPTPERVLIVDEAQDILNLYNSNPEIFDYINANFDNIYFIAGSDPLEGILSEISARYNSTFSRYRIEEYREGLRRAIIDRYSSCLNLGSKNDNDYLQRISEAESSIDSALRSKLISSYPLYIIGVLQHYGKSSGRTVAGSNNFVYDLLIKINLARISTEDDDLSVYESFLGQFAFHMYEIGIEEMSYDDFDEFINKYYEIKKIRSVIGQNKLVNDLVNASILDKSDNSIKFRHYHHLYYFLANHLKNNYKNPRTSDIIDRMISDLSTPLNINTIMFIIFLTKDFDVVEKIMASLRDAISGLPE